MNVFGSRMPTYTVFRQRARTNNPREVRRLFHMDEIGVERARRSQQRKGSRSNLEERSREDGAALREDLAADVARETW